jgi:hypothetical protein
MFAIKTTIVNKDYYDKNSCRFVLCDSCFWFATIIKNDFKISECPICRNKKVYIETIRI